jgi:hypothetical protein
MRKLYPEADSVWRANRSGVRARPVQVAGVQLGLVPARDGHPRLQVVGLLWPTGLCGRGQPKAAFQSGNPWRQPEFGHITQPS